MDKLDIFEMPLDAKIITTVEELQRFYFIAAQDGKDGAELEDERPVLIRGDIV